MKKWQVMCGVALLALTAGTAQAQQAAGISGDVIKIGVLNDQSGTYADLAGPGSVLAARMAAEEMGGAINGKKIEIVFADHQNKPDVGSSIANRWIDTEGVDAIVDVPTSSVALAIQEITKNKNKVHINSTAGTPDLTGKACSPTAVHWTYDNYALANGTGTAIVKSGGKNWYFLTADYAFGHSLEGETKKAVEAAGGKVVGTSRHPFPNTDFSSFLLQAQGSGADVIGLANAGNDTINAIKQAGEFGITQGGKTKLVGLLTFITDVHSIGLQQAQGLLLTTAFYWDTDDATRAWSKKFADKMNGKMPTMAQAGVYGGVLHYLKAIKAAGTDDGKAAVAKMKEMPVNDPFVKNGKVRQDGRMIHDMQLVQVKAPNESKYPWDYFRVVQTIPGDQAFRPLDKGGCSLVQSAATQ